jgi:putative endonuclease
MQGRKKGFEQEAKAAKFLKKEGYKILERNFASPLGEIDIVARHEKCLVFVEVRFRKSSDFGSAKESVDYSKRKKIIKTAGIYLKSRNIKDIPIRFDIAAMDEKGIEIVQNAFGADGHFF